MALAPGMVVGNFEVELDLMETRREFSGMIAH